MAANKSMSKFHLVAVSWDDAHHSLEEYTAKDVELNFHKPARTTNYGLLVKDDDAGITLTSEEDTDGDLRHVFFIPRKMIIEVVDFGLPKRPRVRKLKDPPPAAS